MRLREENTEKEVIAKEEIEERSHDITRIFLKKIFAYK